MPAWSVRCRVTFQRRGLQVDETAVPEEREELRERIASWTEVPLNLLAVALLAIIVLEFSVDLTPVWASRLSSVSLFIWAVARNSWEQIADEMRALIDTTLAENMRCSLKGEQLRVDVVYQPGRVDLRR